MHDLFETGVLPWGEIGNYLVSSTGHSFGFLAAALCASGVADSATMLKRGKVAMTFLAKLGCALAEAFPAAPRCLSFAGISVDEVKSAAAAAEGAEVAVIHSPTACLVSSENALPSLGSLQCTASSVTFPYHHSVLGDVEEDFAGAKEMKELFPRKGAEVTGQLICPDDGGKSGKYLAATVTHNLLSASMDWPAALESVAASGPSKVLFVGGTARSSWFDWGAINTYETKVSSAGKTTLS